VTSCRQQGSSWWRQIIGLSPLQRIASRGRAMVCRCPCVRTRATEGAGPCWCAQCLGPQGRHDWCSYGLDMKFELLFNWWFCYLPSSWWLLLIFVYAFLCNCIYDMLLLKVCRWAPAAASDGSRAEDANGGSDSCVMMNIDVYLQWECLAFYC
jgi:hypothetical protein